MNHAPPAFDELLQQIAAYAVRDDVGSEEAFATARLCLADSLGCGFQAFQFPACQRMVGPIVPGAVLAGGVPVPGTSLELDPVQAAFCIGTLIRWLDYNDTWLAQEWGHPSDNFGAILACAHHRDRETGKRATTMRDVLVAAIKAYEIQGVLALNHSFNRVGLDHVLLVRVASAAVATHLLGGTQTQVANAVSQAWIDGGALRTYRHAPNTGSRKSWAAGDATSRGVRLALWSCAGEKGYATALTTPTWGFEDVLFQGQSLELARPLASYVMENILFKVSFPAEFHAQTAVEAALQIHPQIRRRLADIETIRLETQEAAVRIIAKQGTLHNPADRDHCLQYMVAIALLFGRLTAEDYEDEVAADPRIDALRDRMVVHENSDFSRDYLDPSKRSIGNSVQVFFRDGTSTQPVRIDYPLGHRRRREEAIPLIREKFQIRVRAALNEDVADQLSRLFADQQQLDAMSVHEFLQLLTR